MSFPRLSVGPVPHPPRRPGAGDSLARVLELVTVVGTVDALIVGKVALVQVEGVGRPCSA
jgi:hypothetical protein